MSMHNIIDQLEQQRDRIVAAIQILQGRGAARRNSVVSPVNGRRRRRHLSPAAKKRLSRLAKQRWAAAKKAGKNAL